LKQVYIVMHGQENIKLTNKYYQEIKSRLKSENVC